MSQRFNPQRTKAKEEGVPRFLGKACKKCGGIERWTATGSCVACMRVYQRNHPRVRNKEERRRANERYYSKPGSMAAHVERCKRWEEKNPGKRPSYSRARRARKLAAPGNHTPEQIADLCERQKWRCAHLWCRKSIRGQRHIDHIVALARGGSNDIRNIQILCPTCNWRKSDRDPIDHAQANGCLL